MIHRYYRCNYKPEKNDNLMNIKNNLFILKKNLSNLVEFLLKMQTLISFL